MATAEILVQQSLFAKPIPVRKPKLSVGADIGDLLPSAVIKKMTTAMEQVLASLPKTSSLPGHEVNAEMVESARMQIDARMLKYMKSLEILSTNFDRFLKMYAKLIDKESAGNCYENAILAHMLLKQAGIETEVFRVRGKSSIDSHVFLVMGRKKSIDASNVDLWASEEVLIIDPFMQTIYSAAEFKNNMALCHYNSGTNSVSYVGYDAKEHVVDNEVLDELFANLKYQHSKGASASV